jgi:hypothetical protein
MNGSHEAFRRCRDAAAWDRTIQCQRDRGGNEHDDRHYDEQLE